MATTVPVIRNIHLAAAVLHVASVVALASLASTVQPTITYAVRVRWAGNGTCTSDSRCVAEPWISQMAELHLLRICIAFGAVTVAGHVMQAFAARRVAMWAVGAAYNPIRWLEYSISAPLMYVTIASISGVYGDYALWVGAVAMWSVMLVGAVSEYLFKRVPPTSLSGVVAAAPAASALYGTSLVLFAATWAPVFGSIATVNQDPLRTSTMPDIVYVVVGFMFLVFFSFAVAFVFCSVVKTVRGSPISGLQSEIIYTSLPLISKVALHWLVWNAVLGQDSRLDRGTGGAGGSNLDMQTGFTVAGGAFALGVAFMVCATVYARRSQC